MATIYFTSKPSDQPSPGKQTFAFWPSFN